MTGLLGGGIRQVTSSTLNITAPTGPVVDIELPTQTPAPLRYVSLLAEFDIPSGASTHATYAKSGIFTNDVTGSYQSLPSSVLNGTHFGIDPSGAPNVISFKTPGIYDVSVTPYLAGSQVNTLPAAFEIAMSFIGLGVNAAVTAVGAEEIIHATGNPFGFYRAYLGKVRDLVILPPSVFSYPLAFNLFVLQNSAVDWSDTSPQACALNVKIVRVGEAS